MRRVLLLIFFLFTFSAAHSQILISLLLGDKLNSGKVEFGLDGGLNLSTQSGLKESSSLSSFNLGFYFDIKMKRSWLFHTGVIVKSTVGADKLPVYTVGRADLDSVFVGGSVKRKLSYFHVPLMIKYTFKNHFYAEAGPQLGLLYDAVDEFSNDVLGNEAVYRNEIRDQFYRLDAGFITGIGYRLMGGNGMNLGVRYYLGLVDVVIDDTGSSIANHSLYFTVGIPIGAAKAEKKEAKNEQKQ
ncbi:MAG: PorT family protein [Bacteroidia bacterium]|nr:PorT family protein [Bacteroidia bacterium]